MTDRVVVFSHTPFLNNLKMRPSNNLENKIPLNILNNSASMKVQVYSSWQQLRPDDFGKSRLVMTLLTSLLVLGKLCSLKLVLEGKECKDIHVSSKLEFVERFLANNFVFVICRKQNFYQMIMKITPISTKIVKCYKVKWDIPLVFDRKSMETETTA